MGTWAIARGANGLRGRTSVISRPSFRVSILVFTVVGVSVLGAAGLGCTGVETHRLPTGAKLPAGAEGLSLFGAPLFPPPLASETLQKRREELAEAAANLAKNPADLEAIIWHGRRQAYLGQYRNAIASFTSGLQIHAKSPELYRHRGHRNITLRRFADAIDDLETGRRLIAATPDRVEADGLPNARNTPTSTLHTNIWYHLGLAYYLTGQFEDARRAYEQCLAVSGNPDMQCATRYWLYLTVRRLGRSADSILEPIHAEMDIIENHAYHDLLLLYKGERSADELLEGLSHEEPGSLEQATLGYGVARWHANNGRAEEAERLLRRILKGRQWSAFGFIAAEADLERLGSHP